MELILNIPEKIHVGYQKRNDTATGLLSFPVGENSDGTLVNEKIWNSWCKFPQKDIFNNKPMSGFIVQKNVEKHTAYSSEKFRIFHPEGYEFEISTANMIYIMKHTDISKSEILAECVLSWKRDKLFLLPTNSEPYITYNINKKVTDRVTISVKETLVPGNGYQDSKNRLLIYVGEFQTYCEKSQRINYLNEDDFKVFRNYPTYPKINELYEKSKASKYFDYNKYNRINVEGEPVLVFYNPTNEQFISLRRTLIKKKIESMNINSDELTSLIDTLKEINNFKKVEIIKTEFSPDEINTDYLNKITKAISILAFEHIRRSEDENKHIQMGYLKSPEPLGYDIYRQIYPFSRSIYASEENGKMDILKPLMHMVFGKSYSRSYLDYLLLYCLAEQKLISNEYTKSFKFDDDELFTLFNEKFYLIKDSYIFQAKNEEILIFQINERALDATPLLSVKDLKAILNLYLESVDTQEMENIKMLINNSSISEIIRDEEHLKNCIESIWNAFYKSNINLSEEFGELKIIEKDSSYKINPLTYSIKDSQYENMYNLYGK